MSNDIRDLKWECSLCGKRFQIKVHPQICKYSLCLDCMKLIYNDFVKIFSSNYKVPPLRTFYHSNFFNLNKRLNHFLWKREYDFYLCQNYEKCLNRSDRNNLNVCGFCQGDLEFKPDLKLYKVASPLTLKRTVKNLNFRNEIFNNEFLELESKFQSLISEPETRDVTEMIVRNKHYKNEKCIKNILMY